MNQSPKTKILIVEDELITAEAIGAMLIELGYHVVDKAVSAEVAFLRAQMHHPDLVLMDIRIKGMVDGIMLTQRIQNQLDIPVVYLTAHSDPETLKRVVHTNPYGFVIKPVGTGALDAAIRTALTRYRQKKQSSANQ